MLIQCYLNPIRSLYFAKCNLYFANYLYSERFHVLTVANNKVRALWHISQCSVFGIDRRFKGAYCLHHHPLMLEAV
jgi:hypothetical protein